MWEGKSPEALLLFLSNGYLQDGNEARGSPRGIGWKMGGKKIKGCFRNIIVWNDLIENRYYRNVDDITTIFELKLLDGGTEFGKELRGMDDDLIFSIPLFFNKINLACAQQDQQCEKQNSL
jgi:hypothetical protein